MRRLNKTFFWCRQPRHREVCLAKMPVSCLIVVPLAALTNEEASLGWPGWTLTTEFTEHTVNGIVSERVIMLLQNLKSLHLKKKSRTGNCGFVVLDVLSSTSHTAAYIHTYNYVYFCMLSSHRAWLRCIFGGTVVTGADHVHSRQCLWPQWGTQ